MIEVIGYLKGSDALITKKSNTKKLIFIIVTLIIVTILIINVPLKYNYRFAFNEAYQLTPESPASPEIVELAYDAIKLSGKMRVNVSSQGSKPLDFYKTYFFEGDIVFGDQSLYFASKDASSDALVLFENQELELGEIFGFITTDHYVSYLGKDYALGIGLYFDHDFQPVKIIFGLYDSKGNLVVSRRYNPSLTVLNP